MKKKMMKNSHNGVAMKKDLDGVETRLNRDLKCTEKRLNGDLRKTEERLNKRIDQVMEYIDFKIKPFEEMSRDFYDFKNKTLDRLDWLIGRYQKFEDEYTIQTEQNKRILDRLENHENRIYTIEKSFKQN